MIINHKIRKPIRYLTDILDKSKFVIGVEISGNVLNDRFVKLQNENAANEDSYVYSPKIKNGIYAKRNTIGEDIPNKNKPKETSYRAMYWRLKDWGGNWHEGVTDVSYERYPRDFIEPKNIKFNENKLLNENTILTANIVFEKNKLSSEDLLQIKFIINLLVEAVGKAEIYPLDQLTGIPVRKIKTVNWKILPAGKRIWEYVNHGIDHVSKSEKMMIQKRFNVLDSFLPDKIYKGVDSYTGYIVFYYRKSNYMYLIL